MVVPKDETGHYPKTEIVFAPGCRNNWHTYSAGQMLLVTNGKGYYQEKGKPAMQLSAGDVVVIARLVEHWHGAAPNSPLTHPAISNITAEGAVTWLAPVTEQAYNSVL